MRIRHKGVIQNNLNDAHFIGAIIIAPSCHYGCKGCHNEHLKDDNKYKVVEVEGDKLLDEIDTDILDEGIILSGLEWTESPDEMRFLIEGALDRQLKVLLYTHLSEEEFLDKFPELNGYPVWVKFGEYCEDLKTDSNIHCDIKLATNNQYIKYLGDGIDDYK